MPAQDTKLEPATIAGGGKGKFLCLTILGYKKSGMSEGDYYNHMTKVSAPMTKALMVKYGIVRWTQIHNQAATRAMMSQLYDSQMAKLADFDCFSQVVFKSLQDYKTFKEDPEYKRRLFGDHEKFADTKRSMMTIGWVSQFIDGNAIVDGIEDPAESVAPAETAALVTGSFLSGAMMSLCFIAVPVFLDTTQDAGQLYVQWARMYYYGRALLPILSILTFLLYVHVAGRRWVTGRPWRSWISAGLISTLMIPFTWLVMSPTNDTLFAFEAVAKSGSGGVLPTLEEAQSLVAKWSTLHLIRTLFPLVGAIVGGLAGLGIL
ncbi:hypothetical protein F5B18DRAFT_664378 [Nemania serpens]|nr:hypothetical protein F5B18DRAFT_664378 [Nemania serpens]